MFADDKRAEARRLRAEGHTYAEIGRRLGVSLQRAQAYMSDRPGPRYKALERLVDAIAALGPCTARHLAAHLGWDSQIVRAALRKAERDGFVKVAGREPPRPGRSGYPGVLWDLA